MRKYTVIPVGVSGYSVKVGFWLSYIYESKEHIGTVPSLDFATWFVSKEAAVEAIERLIWSRAMVKKYHLRVDRRNEKSFCVPPWPSRK